MKKFLLTITIVAAISFSSYGFSAFYQCAYPQKDMYANVYEVQKNFIINIYVKRTNYEYAPYVRYTAYDEYGSRLYYNYVSLGPSELAKFKIVRIHTTIEDVNSFNFYFLTGKPGDYAFVSVWW
jgi:hypothetical protein